MRFLPRLGMFALGSLGLLLVVSDAPAQSQTPLTARIQKVLDRPEFRHSLWGIEFYSLDTGVPVFTLNADKLFTPASTTKLLTEGTALDLFGADFRFHTRVYATGKTSSDGTLRGDLILVASGDPNLSGRIAPDDTLRFENHDHAYSGSPETRAVPGDPLLVIRKLAAQVAARGVHRVEGRVLIDASLFPEGTHEAGTDVVISPIIVNDNVIDVTVEPGAVVGAPASVHVSPESGYVHFLNQLKTGAQGSKADFRFDSDVAAADGTHTVTLVGNRPAGSSAILFAYTVPQPNRFAEVVLQEALRQSGITLVPPGAASTPDFKALSAAYSAENLLAEHLSPPLSEDVKVTLKVSQNLHASTMPYLFGALVAHATEDVTQAGFDLERGLLEKAGLDLTAASQGDGAGGVSVYFTPDFMVHYLAYRAKQKNFPVFFQALPILGKDGTLSDIQTTSVAAGHVHAKTGTFVVYDPLNKNLMVTGKGLAGYVTTVDGRHLAFAIYANRVPVPADEDEAITRIVGQALGEIAAAAYDSPADSPAH